MNRKRETARRATTLQGSDVRAVTSVQHLIQSTLPKDSVILARLNGVRRCGSGWSARCPAHDDRSPSLSIGIGASGRILIYCHAGCTYAEIMQALGATTNDLHVDATSARLIPAKDRSRYALRLWESSRPIAGTIAGKYLHMRGITMSPPPSLRFHPRLRHPTGIYAPAMVAAVQNREGQLVAVHRTFLKPDGSGKSELNPCKMGLGSIVGGAVRLAEAAKIVCLCEGTETGASIQQATSIATWVTLGTANLARVEVPEIVRTIIIAADADTPGERAARMAAQRFLHQGLRVRIARPATGDFNDMLLAR